MGIYNNKIKGFAFYTERLASKIEFIVDVYISAGIYDIHPIQTITVTKTYSLIDVVINTASLYKSKMLFRCLVVAEVRSSL